MKSIYTPKWTAAQLARLAAAHREIPLQTFRITICIVGLGYTSHTVVTRGIGAACDMVKNMYKDGEVEIVSARLQPYA